MVIYLEQGADLHMAQRMPLPLTVSCFSKIQIGFTFLVPAHPGSPRKRAIKWVCVCVCVYVMIIVTLSQKCCRGTLRSQQQKLSQLSLNRNVFSCHRKARNDYVAWTLFSIRKCATLLFLCLCSSNVLGCRHLVSGCPSVSHTCTPGHGHCRLASCQLLVIFVVAV